MNKMCPACGATYGPEAEACVAHPDERLMLVGAETNYVGQTLDGKYRLIAKLGEGGMGSVYLAVQSQIEREVAVKILRSEFKVNQTAVKRFLREARAASKLSHPHTITVYDFGQAMSGDLYIVMERLTGCSLADLLDDVGAMEAERAVHILSQICDSLTEAHRVGITHRDLKPENIYIEQKAGMPDFVKVLDFGIAKMRADDDDIAKATQTGMICGTPTYMSPEQALGRDLDGRSDIYALGILLYELLTNQRPFEGDAAMEVMLKHINESPPDIFQRTGIRVPHGLQEAIEQLLAKDPTNRPPNCEEVKKLLVAGLSTPLIGSIEDEPALNPDARNRPHMRAFLPEKTGLAGQSGATTDLDAARLSRGGQSSASTRRRDWFWPTAAILLLLAVIGMVLASVGSFSAEPPPTPSEARATSALTTPVPPSKDAPATRATPADAPPAEPELVAPAVVVEAPKQPELTEIHVTSEPPGASVYVEETLIGPTPLTYPRTRGSGEVVLTLKLKGYDDKTERVATVLPSLDINVPLTRARRAATGAGPGAAGGTRRAPPGAEPSGTW
jgi:serine/threonine protein kinase